MPIKNSIHILSYLFILICFIMLFYVRYQKQTSTIHENSESLLYVSISITICSSLILLVSKIPRRKKSFTTKLSYYKINDKVSYDKNNYILFYEDKRIELTPQNGKLLNLFLEAQDYYLTNEHIEKNLWGKLYNTHERRLKAITRLRHELNNTHILKIETHRGKGYRLISE